VGYWLCGWPSDPDARVQVKDTHLLLVCPVHAAVYEKAGWSKQDIRDQPMCRSPDAGGRSCQGEPLRKMRRSLIAIGTQL
jgi:hypothetical protein